MLIFHKMLANTDVFKCKWYLKLNCFLAVGSPKGDIAVGFHIRWEYKFWKHFTRRTWGLYSISKWNPPSFEEENDILTSVFYMMGKSPFKTHHKVYFLLYHLLGQWVVLKIKETVKVNLFTAAEANSAKEKYTFLV